MDTTGAIEQPQVRSKGITHLQSDYSSESTSESTSPMETLKLSDATQLLSTRGYDAQSSRSWFKIIEIISDVYEEKTNPNGYISIGIAENVGHWTIVIDSIISNVELELEADASGVD